jgi:hypothetical protein
MTSLRRRIENLEAHGGECPECGFDGDWSNVDIVVEWYARPGNTTDRRKPPTARPAASPRI